MHSLRAKEIKHSPNSQAVPKVSDVLLLLKGALCKQDAKIIGELNSLNLDSFIETG